MSYRKIHGDYFGYVCEGCQSSEWGRANPGDHQCPHCKYISLKNEASRYPLCHSEIRSDYWIPVRAAQKILEEESRQLQQKYEEDSRERAENNRIGRQKLNYFFVIGTGIVLTILIFLVPSMIYPDGKVCVAILGIILIIGLFVFIDFLKATRY